MIAVKSIVVRVEQKRSIQRAPIGLTAAAAIDTLLDGAIIRAGFTGSQATGNLLAAALAIELFFLTLSVGSEFRVMSRRPWPGLAAGTGVSLLLVMGSIAAGPLLVGAPQEQVAMALAFGAAALIYLIAEELLVEAIQAEVSALSTAMLFAGFLVLMAFKILGT